jgi:hypothetical protein
MLRSLVDPNSIPLGWRTQVAQAKVYSDNEGSVRRLLPPNVGEFPFRLPPIFQLMAWHLFAI